MLSKLLKEENIRVSHEETSQKFSTSSTRRINTRIDKDHKNTLYIILNEFNSKYQEYRSLQQKIEFYTIQEKPIDQFKFSLVNFKNELSKFMLEINPYKNSYTQDDEIYFTIHALLIKAKILFFRCMEFNCYDNGFSKEEKDGILYSAVLYAKNAIKHYMETKSERINITNDIQLQNDLFFTFERLITHADELKKFKFDDNTFKDDPAEYKILARSFANDFDSTEVVSLKMKFLYLWDRILSEYKANDYESSKQTTTDFKEQCLAVTNKISALILTSSCDLEKNTIDFIVVKHYLMLINQMTDRSSIQFAMPDSRNIYDEIKDMSAKKYNDYLVFTKSAIKELVTPCAQLLMTVDLTRFQSGESIFALSHYLPALFRCVYNHLVILTAWMELNGSMSNSRLYIATLKELIDTRELSDSINELYSRLSDFSSVIPRFIQLRIHGPDEKKSEDFNSHIADVFSEHGKKEKQVKKYVKKYLEIINSEEEKKSLKFENNKKIFAAESWQQFQKTNQEADEDQNEISFLSEQLMQVEKKDLPNPYDKMKNDLLNLELEAHKIYEETLPILRQINSLLKYGIRNVESEECKVQKEIFLAARRKLKNLRQKRKEYIKTFSKCKASLDKSECDGVQFEASIIVDMIETILERLENGEKQHNQLRDDFEAAFNKDCIAEGEKYVESVPHLKKIAHTKSTEDFYQYGLGRFGEYARINRDRGVTSNHAKYRQLLVQRGTFFKREIDKNRKILDVDVSVLQLTSS